MDDEDAIYAQGADFMLRKTRNLSLAIMVMTTGYAIATVTVVRAMDLTGFTLLVMTTTAIMNAWVTRRVVVEIPKYRNMLTDPRLDQSRGVIVTMILIDAVAMLASVAAAAWLLLHIVQTVS